MASGRRTSPTARGARTSTAKRSSQAAAPTVAPLYARLPHGPHRLARDEVVLHQRTRIHGALIEAVARNGYEQTSVKEVIALAGVSRRSFYEQFANKQAAFLATFDLLARRQLQQIRSAYLASDGHLAQRLGAGVGRFAQTITEDHKASVLVVLEAQTAGVDGVQRLHRATSACEQMLAQGFAQAPDGVALPAPVVRAIAGGLHGAASACLRGGRPSAEPELAEELLGWTLAFHSAASERLASHLAGELKARLREIASTYGRGLGGVETVAQDERARLLQGALRLATREQYGTLSAPQIADEANVSVDVFCTQFADKHDCYLAALDSIGEELLAIAADRDLIAGDWPSAVRRVLAELMRHLADHPLQARTLVQEAFFAGAEGVRRIVELANTIAMLLTEGAPATARGELTVDAIAGAIWHTVRCQVAVGRVPLLVALSEHLAYVVLAPYLGAEAAVEILTEGRLPASRGAFATSAPRGT